jgi:tetratricopeptide (TPR) repeat protein
MSCYDKAIAEDPDSADAYYGRAEVHRRLGEFKDAVKDYTEAIRLDPKNARARAGRALVESDPSAALRDANAALELDDSLELAYYVRGSAYVDMALDIDWDLRKHPECRQWLNNAIADLTKAIELRPNDSYSYSERALAYELMGEMEKSKADNLKASQLEEAQ